QLVGAVMDHQAEAAREAFDLGERLPQEPGAVGEATAGEIVEARQVAVVEAQKVAPLRARAACGAGRAGLDAGFPEVVEGGAEGGDAAGARTQVFGQGAARLLDEAGDDRLAHAWRDDADGGRPRGARRRPRQRVVVV